MSVNFFGTKTLIFIFYLGTISARKNRATAYKGTEMLVKIQDAPESMVALLKEATGCGTASKAFMSAAGAYLSLTEQVAVQTRELDQIRERLSVAERVLEQAHSAALAILGCTNPEVLKPSWTSFSEVVQGTKSPGSIKDLVESFEKQGDDEKDQA